MSNTPNTLPEEAQNKIEQEAEDLYNTLDEKARDYDHFEYGLPMFDKCKQPIIDVLTDHALKLQQAEENIKQLEQWKKEATMLLDPLLDWGHAQKDIPLGNDVTVEVLRKAKRYTEAEEMMGRMADRLRVLNERIDVLWNTVGTSKPIPENHAAIITKVQRECYKLLTEYNNREVT